VGQRCDSTAVVEAERVNAITRSVMSTVKPPTTAEEEIVNEDLGGVSATDLIFRFQELVWRIGQLEYREKLANFQGMVAPVPVAMRLEASALGDEIIKRMVG